MCRLYIGGAAGSETSRWPGWLYVYSCLVRASPRQGSGSCTSLFWWLSPPGAGHGRKVWRVRWAAPEIRVRNRPSRCTWPRGQRPWLVYLHGWSAGSWWRPRGQREGSGRVLELDQAGRAAKVRPVRMKESVVHEHEDNAGEEAGEDDAQSGHGEGVCAGRRAVQVPQRTQGCVL